MDKVILTTFTDPMMGLSYECEPIFRKLETHFSGQIEFRYVMSGLVRDVRDFMMPEELACTFTEGIRRYNKRLAGIYESEEAISGMPINMTDFHLFSPEHITSMPLNLAYKAAQLACPEKADLFLYDLRYATIVDCRPTTRLEEIVKVAANTGIDTEVFLKHYNDGSAEEAIDRDLKFGRELGIRTLPAYLVQYGEKALIFRSFCYDDFVSMIYRITGGNIVPHAITPTRDAFRKLLNVHPRISPIEVRESFHLESIEAVREFIQPLIDSGELSIEEVHHGWFIRRNHNENNI